MGTAARKLESPKQPQLRVFNPDDDLERRYDRWLSKTGEPVAAAILATANHTADKREPTESTLKPSDVAKELSVSPATVIGWIRSGQLKAANIATGNRPRYVIKREDVDSFLRCRQPEPKCRRRQRTSGKRY